MTEIRKENYGEILVIYSSLQFVLLMKFFVKTVRLLKDCDRSRNNDREKVVREVSSSNPSADYLITKRK